MHRGSNPRILRLPFKPISVKSVRLEYSSYNSNDELDIDQVSVWPTDSIRSRKGKTTAWCANFHDEKLTTDDFARRRLHPCEIKVRL